MRDKPAGFLNIADHHSSSSICIEARCLWANQHGDLYLVTPGEDTISKGIANQTLVVVRENQRVEFLEGRKNLPDQFSLGFRTEGIASFTVNANDVLVSCNKDRKSTRLNSSHQIISYAVFCLKKKKIRC